MYYFLQRHLERCTILILLTNFRSNIWTEIYLYLAGGAVLALEQMQNEEKDGSISATLWDMSYLQLGGGIPTPSEYKALFTKNGFSEVTCTLAQDWNDYDIIFAKKSKK